MTYRRKKPIKSSSSGFSTRTRPNKIPKSIIYEEEEEDDEDEYYEDNESINSASSPNSPSRTIKSSSILAPNPLFQPLTTDTYVSISPFPIFRGADEECPFAHLSRFLKVSRANNVSSEQSMTRIFPITLEDEAGRWFDLNVEPYPNLSWEEIKSSFLEAYQKSDFGTELVSMKQKDEESVRSYFLRLQWVLRKWPEHGLNEDLIKGVFVDGLKGDFREWIVPQKPDSLDEALRLAFAWERTKKMGLKCGFCGGVHEERDCEVRARMREIEGKDSDVQRKTRCKCSKHQCENKRTDTIY